MKYRIVFLLMLMLAFNLSADEHKYHHHSKKELFHKSVDNLSRAVLDIEPNNGAILSERAVFGETGTAVAEICESNDIEHIEVGCETISNEAVNVLFDFPEYSQHTIYYRPNIIVDGFKLIQAVVLDNKIQKLVFQDTFSQEMFFVSNNEQLINIINKELKIREFKPNNDPLEGDSIDPDEEIHNSPIGRGPIDIWLPPGSPNQPFRSKDSAGDTPPINPPYISIENSTSLVIPDSPEKIEHSPGFTTAIVLYTDSVLNTYGRDTIRQKIRDVNLRYRGFLRNNDIISDTNLGAFSWVAAYENNESGNITKQAFMKIPNEICNAVGGCESGNWDELLSAISHSSAIRDLKAIWKADSVMVLTKSGHKNRKAVGIAYRLTRPRDMTQADKAVSVVRFDSGVETYLHEIFHNLGAGHSFANTQQPGTAPGAGFLGRFYHPETTGQHPIKTFMTYENVCWDNFAPIPPCTERCLKVEHFSSPSKVFKYDSANITIGTAQANNQLQVSNMIWTVNNFSTHYKVSEPKITLISRSPEPNQPQLFSAKDSQVNSREVIEWSVRLPSGAIAHRTIVGDKNKNFSFTPVVVGDYKVFLKIGSKQDTYNLKIKVADIQTPMFHLTPNRYGVTYDMRWTEISEADTYKVRLDGVLIATEKSNIPLYTETFTIQIPPSVGKYLTLQACDSNSNRCGNEIGRVIPNLRNCGPQGCIL